MFLDRIKIALKAGCGGDGAVSFVHTALNQFGGPDGGDGGRGGHIYIRGKGDISTLYTFKFKKKFEAEDGERGQSGQKSGRAGKDIYIDVPLGTVILNEEGDKIITDIIEDGQVFKILSGGSGGKGNAFYKSSVRQAPKFSQSGEVTEVRQVTLELKTLADVGIVGFPNVGKSTLLSVITNARPKIANYHFTTLHPNLGVVSFKDKFFTVADIPGLIKGASEGTGLGHYFLRHLERVRLIVHLIDISEIDGRSAADDYFTINTELKKYSERLGKLEQIVVLAKIDLLTEESLKAKTKEFKHKTGVQEVLMLSGITHKGTDMLVSFMAEKLDKIPSPKPFLSQMENFDRHDKDSLEIVRGSDGSFELSGGKIDQLVRGVVLSDPISFAYFQKRLKEDGIIDLLKKRGMKNGDTVHIKDIVFDYIE